MPRRMALPEHQRFVRNAPLHAGTVRMTRYRTLISLTTVVLSVAAGDAWAQQCTSACYMQSCSPTSSTIAFCDGQLHRCGNASGNGAGCIRDDPQHDWFCRTCESSIACSNPTVCACDPLADDCLQQCDGAPCAPPPPCADACCRRGSPQGSPLLGGDPFTLDAPVSYFVSVDATVKTGATTLNFTRYYIANDSAWSFDHQLKTNGGTPLPTPFGSTQNGTSLRWWHNYYTFVSEYAYGRNIRTWRSPSGKSVRFTVGNGCSTPPCRLDLAPGQSEVTEQLWRVADGFELRSADGLTTRYTQKELSTDRTMYFPSEVRGVTGAVLYSFKYANPSGCSAATGSDPGVPYLSRVYALDGGAGELDFSYKLLSLPSGGTACVLTSVFAADSVGALQRVRVALIGRA